MGVSLGWQNIQQAVTFTIQLMEYVRVELSIFSSCAFVTKIDGRGESDERSYGWNRWNHVSKMAEN